MKTLITWNNILLSEYETIDLVTTECHDAARELYMKKGFELRQLYHKQIIGTLVQVLMYEFSLKVPRGHRNA